jgi:very-short-patch-repair endonuclease
MLDVATQVSTGVMSTWLQQWLSNKVVTLEQLEHQMAQVRGHAGIPAVRAALTASTVLHAAADSGTEAQLGTLLMRHGLPPVSLHHLVTIGSGAEYELDWSYPEWFVAFELDGYGVHLRSVEAFEHDRFRRNELEIAGWTILNFTSRQVTRRPKVVVEQVRRLLESRSML